MDERLKQQLDFILEIDKDDEALVKSLKTVMRKVRYWPSFEWRALIVDL